MKILVTGGAGFIGSHLVEKLIQANHDVTVIDNLLCGNIHNLSNIIDSSKLTFVKSDIRESDTLSYYSKGCKMIIHLAANPDVRVGYHDTSIDFNLNIHNTKIVLDIFKENPETNTIVLASTSTVYGEAKIMPTPESYGPLLPISLYGGSKLACEAMLSAYCNLFKKNGFIFRLANVIGSRSNHGVIYDFVRKLHKSTQSLEILGDGTQRKSYVHVSDCIDAFLIALSSNGEENVNVFNIGSMDYIDVGTIANIVIEKFAHASTTNLLFNSAVEGGRGWKGDVKEMLLDTSRIRTAGWQPRYDTSRKAVEKAVDEIVSELKVGIQL